MRKSFKLPEKLEKGDKIALVGIGDGPSKQEYPKHFERGKKRLEEVFNLEPVEFPSVRMSRTEKRKNLGKRAEDLEDAFRDDEIKGVLAPVGGSDQIKLLNHISPEVLKEDPTRFYGYSDNTVLNSFLWKH
ncbi:MAG: LD-carboxypeptidase, partial [Candidatus Nanohalobium sp.]